MTDREKSLAEFRQGIGGIDPMLDQAEGYGRAIRATQKVVRSQGQVMSAALENNFQLYHTNKKLVAQNRGLTAEVKHLERRLELADKENARLAEYIQRLETGGGDKFKALYEDCRKTLQAFLFDLVDPDKLRERLQDMDEQRKELEKLPELVTRKELVAMEVVQPTPEELQELQRERGAEQ